MAPPLAQLRTILWRNILIKKRCWKRTLSEIFIPVLLVGATILLTLGVKSHTNIPPSYQFAPHNITRPLFAPFHSQPITASPDIPVTYDIMDYVIKALNVTSLRYHVRNDVTSGEADSNYITKRNMTDVGIEFLWQNISGMVGVEGYVIRLPREIVEYVTSECSFGDYMERCTRRTDGLTTECPGSQPLLSGLVTLQWAVETALTQIFRNPEFKSPELQVQMMPLPTYKPGVTNTQLLVSVSMMIALIPLAFSVTVAMVTEKKNWTKVMLRIFGLNDFLFWVSWWLIYMLLVIAVSALSTILVSMTGVLADSGLPFFFIMVVLYGASILGWSSIVSIFFNSPKIAGWVSSVTCVLLGLLYLSVSLTRPTIWVSTGGDMTQSSVPFGGQLVFSVFSPAAFALGLDKLVFDTEENVPTNVTAGQFPLLAVILMLAFDCVVYAILTIYLDLVVTDPYRLSRKAWFCLTPSYWRGRHNDVGSDVIPTDTPEGPHIEPINDSQAQHRTIRIRDLCKSFSSGQREPVSGLNGLLVANICGDADNSGEGLNLDIVEGQITCILGHPGSGKTTLINILAGVTSPSSGVAFISNLDVSSIRDQRDLACAVSFCSQRDFILGDLSVEEHMHIAGSLRGITRDNMEHQILSSLTTFHLDKERETMAQELTRCQRRRLSLAMGLLLDTKVLLLDGPTLEMAPEERQHLRKVLHQKKDGRVIVFTTTDMEEADYFSDRKVVLSKGRLRCVGSSEFLKQHFNVGYRLHLTVREAANTDRLMRVVRSHVRGASLVQFRDSTLTIAMPVLKADNFTALFQQLESEESGRDHLGVTRFGLTLTTLEQIFLKLGEEENGGNAFISPLLTPCPDTFPDDDTSDIGHQHQSRGSVFPHRRSSLPTSPYTSGDVNPRRQSTSTVPKTRKSASALQFLETSEGSVHEEGGAHGKLGARSRKMSDLFTKVTHRDKQRSYEDIHPSSRTFAGDKPRRFSLFSTSHSTQHKSKSFYKKHAMSHVTGAENASLEHLEERPESTGTALPKATAERRATVAAFQNFRSLAQQKNLSSIASLGEEPFMPSDRLEKLSLFDSYGQIRKTSITDTMEPTTESHTADSSSEYGHVLPLKIGEVLANMHPPRQGVCLELQRLSAMLKLGALIHLCNKRWLLLRMMVPLVLTLLAVGTSHALLPVAEWSSRQTDRMPLLGLSRLVYRNASGVPVDNLLEDFSRTVPVLEYMSRLISDQLDALSSLESVLDIVQSNGQAYRLHYNATCALALPRLLSFIAHVTRNATTNDSALNSTNITTNSRSSNGRQDAFLAPNASGWLQPWPSLTRHENRGRLDWVPILFLGLALILTSCSFAVRLIRERKENLRSYLAVTGVSRWVYYGSAVTTDVLLFALPATILVFLCAVSQMAVFEGDGSIYSLAVLVALFVVAGILWVHAISFFCRQPKTWLLYFIPLIVLVTLGCFFMVIFLEKDGAEHTATVLHYVFTIVWTPYVPFGALHYMAKVGSKERRNNYTIYVFQFDSNIDICIIVLAADVVLLWCLVMVLDKLSFRPPTCPCSNNSEKIHHPDSTKHNTDDSVRKETLRVQDLHQNHSKWPKLVVEGVSKTSNADKKKVMTAVDTVTFAVDQRDVLGLLGPPGAGQSSLVNVMLGLSPLSAGSVYVDSKPKEHTERWEAREKIGYCPNYSPLWVGLTVDQHVQLVGQLRGLSKLDIHSFKNSLYHDLDLRDCRSHKVTQLSEGDKRKVSFAMCMVGTHTIMFIEDPSLGMDTRSRRLYWDAVNYFLKASQRCTVLSTHCVEEAETLCSRLAVMVNGQFRCLGTPEELKSRCDRVYRLEVNLGPWDEHHGPQRMDMLVRLLQEMFPGLQKMDQFQQRAIFRIQSLDEHMSLATTFHTLESLKRNLGLESFTFSQLDLEQMFLDCAREQQEGAKRCYTNLTDTNPNSTCYSAPETTGPRMRQSDLQVSSPDSGVLASPDSDALTSPDPDVHPPTNSKSTDGESGASGQGAISDADAAVGMVIVHSGENVNGGVVSGMEEGEVKDAGAAAPLALSLGLEGVDNLAYAACDGESGQTMQTYL